MVDALQAKNSYLSAFSDWEKSALTQDPFWLRETREAALAQFGETGFPTTKDEFWKYTDLDSLLGHSFALTGDRQPKAAVLPELKSLGFDPEKAHLMVFVNGHFSKELSSLKSLTHGLKMQNLIECL